MQAPCKARVSLVRITPPCTPCSFLRCALPLKPYSCSCCLRHPPLLMLLLLWTAGLLLHDGFLHHVLVV
jgi:hypothetical protein